MLEQQRHQALETSAQQREAAVEQAAELKKKVEGLKARNKALGRELKMSKERVEATESELETERNKVRELMEVTREVVVSRKPPQAQSPQHQLNGPEVRRLHEKVALVCPYPHDTVALW